MAILLLENVTFDYITEAGAHRAVDDVSFSVDPGEFVCILGHNGSGKSTLAKLMNALLMPTSGRIVVDGIVTSEEPELWKVRRHAGMVFQNPDNQIVSSVVEEDVAFGPENLGMPREEIKKNVQRALHAVGMEGFEKRAPNMLSGGQKQRIAIAGVLAMLPDIIIFDEPTAMLDPVGRAEVLATIKTLNRKLGKTIIYITHYMDEIVEADRLLVMNDGRLIASGTPKDVFAQKELVEQAGLSLPIAAEIYNDLNNMGIDLGDCPVTKEELVEKLCPLL